MGRSLWTILMRMDSMLKLEDQERLANLLDKEDFWLTTRSASESRKVDGRWFRIPKRQWVLMPTKATSTSFDDVSVVRRKAEMVRSMKLGGAMVWALDLDDFKNRCGCEHHPLLRTINRVLREYPVADPGCNLASI